MYILLGLISILGALWIALGNLFLDPAFGYYSPFATGSFLALMASVILMARRYEKRAGAGIVTGLFSLLITVTHITMTVAPGNYHPTDTLTGIMLPVGIALTAMLLLVAPVTLLLCKKVKKKKKKKKGGTTRRMKTKVKSEAETHDDDADVHGVRSMPVATVGVVKIAGVQGNPLYEIRSDRPYDDGYLVVAVNIGGGVVGYLTIAPGQTASSKRLSPQLEDSAPPSIIEYEEMDVAQARRVTEISDIPVYDTAEYRSDLPPPTAVLVRA